MGGGTTRLWDTEVRDRVEAVTLCGENETFNPRDRGASTLWGPTHHKQQLASESTGVFPVLNKSPVSNEIFFYTACLVTNFNRGKRMNARSCASPNVRDLLRNECRHSAEMKKPKFRFLTTEQVKMEGPERDRPRNAMIPVTHF